MDNWQAEQNEIRGRIRALFLFMLSGYILMGLGTLWWGILRSDDILTREDNPRTVEAELRIQRGRIVDVSGVVLAENQGTPERQIRFYPEPEAEPAIGYYSLRYGVAGVEGALDAILRGDTDEDLVLLERRLFHAPQIGEDVRLSLDIELQRTLAEAMGDETGAAILLYLPRSSENPIAQVRAMVSLPSYNPNLLNEQFDLLTEETDGPLLNRVTQAPYQPGMALFPFIWASAIDKGVISYQPIDDVLMADADRLINAWQIDGLVTVWQEWGFLSQPDFVLPAFEPSQEFQETDSLANAVVGEGSLLVTPLQVALAASTMAQSGTQPQLSLVSSVGRDGNWSNYTAVGENASIVIPTESADLARDVFFSDEQDGLTGYSASVPAGENRYNHWLIFISPNTSPISAVFVAVIENNQPTIDWSAFQPILNPYAN